MPIRLSADEQFQILSIPFLLTNGKLHGFAA